MASAVLLLTCPDGPGIIAAVADFVASRGGNIVRSEQHSDEMSGTFFQRVEIDLDGLAIAPDAILDELRPISERFDMDARLRLRDHRPKVAIMVSKQAHCLYDLLVRWRTGELPIDIVAVVANHPDHADAATAFGVPFHLVPVTAATKADDEARAMAIIDDAGAELVVLARYMQILSPVFVAHHPERIINIHHSFLPAFAGASPYRQAFERGVKVIGATAHYVTADLDEGPIIDQDVIHVTHRDDPIDLARRGRDLEAIVLARAVRAHVEARVLVHGRRTVVFA